MATIRLEGGTHYLLLRRAPGGKSHQVSGFARFSDALSNWSRGARLSPIFALNKAPAPSFGGKAKRSLLFFGPVYPGNLVAKNLPDLYLSVGLLNVVAVCTSKTEARVVKSICQKYRAHWEQWDLVGDHVVGIDSAEVVQSTAQAPKSLLRPLPVNTATMRAAEFE